MKKKKLEELTKKMAKKYQKTFEMLEEYDNGKVKKYRQVCEWLRHEKRPNRS